MDDIERVYRHLVRTLRASYPHFLTQPFEVGELYQTILPYRLHRRELGFETNQDYEIAMLELLSGARGYLVVDDRMRDVLSAEQSAPNPDPTIVRDFASSHVALAPEGLQRLEQEGRAAGSLRSLPSPTIPMPPRASASYANLTAANPRQGVPTPAAVSAPEGQPARRASRPLRIAAVGDTCSFCRGELPAGRPITFCPHCGQDLTVVHCPACGSELERGWKFCVTCGRTSSDG